ncbi:hypothetical protein M011DRAFT_472407 [Sporormia fimetaria CBS 119925]|uniref:DUF1308 domain-containing protein n=1 Tax=Sporormia fimetaria CBS 119925 TaxID=1340428 RepID=A0A6A6UWF0_9PLEO|nr:hypothetical protein M011DRAFT_472407 [Sporormia fimetaria CBS 119925]
MSTSLPSELESLSLDSSSSKENSAPQTHSQPNLPPDLLTTINTLITRCETLSNEVETYVSAVTTHHSALRNHGPVEYGTLRSDFKNELNFVRQKLTSPDLIEQKARNYINSSNLVYHEALWDAAKRSSGLMAFRKYFFWNRRKEGHAPKGLSLSKGAQTKGKSAALVDIVAREGREWIRVSTTNDRRLVFELAKQGWRHDSDSDSDDDDQDTRQQAAHDDSDDEDDPEILRNARDLARAARANPVRGHAPQVRIVLPRIRAHLTPAIDAILTKIRATGAILQTADTIPPTPPLSAVLPTLLVNHARDLSHVLNIDCTILLALISDISHRECAVQAWHPREVQEQISSEAHEKLLPTHLYPAMRGHDLVTTAAAAGQMRLIVDTIATDTEKLRADILLSANAFAGCTKDECMQRWKELSDHEVPPDFNIPIRVDETVVDDAKLPAVKQRLSEQLSELNRDIFLYGWAKGITTLSSNRSCARAIEATINEVGLEDGEAGPHVWLCGESRSLIAKKGRNH